EAQVWLKDNLKNSSEKKALTPNERLGKRIERDLKRHRVGDTALIYTNHYAMYGKYGWGVKIDHPDKSKKHAGAFKKSSASRVSLYAFLEGLKSARGFTNTVIVVENDYIVNALRKGWPMAWRDNNWNTWKGRSPINVDLWQQILPLFEEVDPLLELIPVHASVTLIKEAKLLAMEACKSKDLRIDRGLQPFKGKFKKKRRRKRSKHPLNSKPTYSFSI
ncbi:MAG: RNase H family protein, partial [Candidatus Marinimicrobia bacterium]|nr:RNase H family protein [Candidatus Neomarinimicrobiota bacterium]